MCDTDWFKSTRSTGGSDNCVEMRITDTAVGVRDSKNLDGPLLAVAPVQWRAFVTGAKAGSFDLPS